MRKSIRFGLGVAAAVAVMGLNNAAFADDDAGEKAFKKYCTACHTIEAGKNRVGPSLHGIVGRAAGSVAGFAYSDANKNSGITWTEDKLAVYLADPKAMLPGNKMTFAGIKKPEELTAVVAYLKDKAK
jgi:cytochrome c